ncbi:hypothetical protein LTR17_025977 [Elasticomyces elasticus]|nr:hypothetical protein LTR17_025977 [Elasticomyces elasticus]
MSSAMDRPHGHFETSRRPTDSSVAVVDPMAHIPATSTSKQFMPSLATKSPAIAKTRLQQIIRKRIKPGSTIYCRRATTKKHKPVAAGHDDGTYASSPKEDTEPEGVEAVEESMVDEIAK